MKVLAILCFCGTSILCLAQSNYTSAQYGISFRYPRAYDVKQGDLGDDEGDEWRLGYLGPIPMEFVASGGVRVVTVKKPHGAYPGTDLGIAFLTVSVNRHLTRDECTQFPHDFAEFKKPVRKIGDVVFHGLEQGETAVSHHYGGTYYHGFANGWCYEIGMGVTTAGSGDVDGTKYVDENQVLARLDKIFQTVTVHVPKASHSKLK